MATLDATLSGNQSNSYVTLANADGIASNQTFADDWAAKTEDEKTVALIVATRWMETLSYGGDRCKASQRLSWPRSGAVCDGVTSDCSGIPYAIQETEVILAYQYMKYPNSFPDIGGGGGSAPTGTFIKRQKLDVLEIEYDQFNNAVASSCDTCGDPAIISAFPWLKDLLKCWVKGIGTQQMIRLYRN